MRAVIQRVKYCNVKVDNVTISEIDEGLLILLGVEDTDTEDDIDKLSSKIVRLRIFNDEQGKMNKSVIDINGEIMVVSQFTLLAQTHKGNRPSYIKAAAPQKAIPDYESFIRKIESETGKTVKHGEFGADMQVSLTNDGPVTIIIDTKIKE